MPNLPPTFTGPRTTRQRKNAQSKERQARRYLSTGHRRWRRIRKQALAIEPLCRMCASHNKVTPATEVDHADGDSFNNKPDNLVALCKACHARKTASEQGRGEDGRWL